MEGEKPKHRGREEAVGKGQSSHHQHPLPNHPTERSSWPSQETSLSPVAVSSPGKTRYFRWRESERGQGQEAGLLEGSKAQKRLRKLPLALVLSLFLHNASKDLAELVQILNSQRPVFGLSQLFILRSILRLSFSVFCLSFFSSPKGCLLSQNHSRTVTKSGTWLPGVFLCIAVISP